MRYETETILWYADGSFEVFDQYTGLGKCQDYGAFIREWNKGLDESPRRIIRIATSIFSVPLGKTRG